MQLLHDFPLCFGQLECAQLRISIGRYRIDRLLILQSELQHIEH
jgi:hypothetical protein